MSKQMGVAGRRRGAAVKLVGAVLVVAGLVSACASDDAASGESVAPSASTDTTHTTATSSTDSTVSPVTDVSASSEPAASDATDPPQAEEGGTLNFGAIAAPVSLNPGIGDPAFVAVYGWAYDPLIELLPDGTYGPSLAVDWGYVDDANQRYELTLRDGLKFSDGTDLDAAAVKTYLDYVRAQPTSAAAALVNVSNIEVIDELSVGIDLSTSDPGLTAMFSQSSPAAYIASPAAVADPTSLDFGSAGAGPYMFVPEDSTVNDLYTFVPNPNYWDPASVHWDEVAVRIIPNSSSMIEAFRAGQIQASNGDPTTIQAAEDAGLTVVSAPQTLTGLNLIDRGGDLSPGVGDVRVRQALNHAVDREAIAEALYGDAALALSQYSLAGQPGHDPALDEANAYDPDLARQMLADAGYADGLTITVIDVNLIGMHTLVEAIAGQLAEVGVTLEITTAPDVNGYIGGMLGKQFPTAAVAYGLFNMQTLYAGYVNPLGPFNPFQTVDAELDALYAEYYATTGDTSDVEQRINARLVDQAWALPVVGAPLAYYLAEGLTGIEATGGNAAVPILADIHSA